VVLVSVLIAPVLMAAATAVERRLGPSAAGWVAALPVSLAVAVLAVGADSNVGHASAMALSAATHVFAQVVFGIVFAAALVRRGLILGGAAGTLAYVVCSLALTYVPDLPAIGLAIPALIAAPRLIPAGPPVADSPKEWISSAATCVASMAIVAAAVVTAQLAGPVIAGAIAAFPTMSTALAVAIATRRDATAAASALLGLVRSLPCYLTFCLLFVLLEPPLGLTALALALVGCLAAAHLTWTRVPLPNIRVES
jgi:hypothetical protein